MKSKQVLIAVLAAAVLETAMAQAPAPTPPREEIAYAAPAPSQIEAPLTVIHGTADPLFPPAHGEALAAAVPGADLVLLEGGGHELHEGDWDEIVAAMVR